MLRAVLFAYPVLLLGQSQPVVQDKATLEGQVINAATGEPVRKARLVLRINAPPSQGQQPAPPAIPPSVAVSDSAGKFDFDKLEPGDYQLTARRDGFANAQAGNRDGVKKPDPILLAAGDHKTGVVLRMTPYGVIAGRILDEDGDPIQGIQVSTVTYRYNTRGRELSEPNKATSDDLGEFRLYNLPAGKYFLKAGPPQMRLRSAPEEGESFIPAYYPGAGDPASATQLELAPGQQLRGLNLTLRRAKLATLRGRVVAPPGIGAQFGIMILEGNGSSSSTNSLSDKENKFELFGVPPGQIYLLGSYVQNGQRYAAQLPLTVGTSDMNGLEVRPLAPFEITGQVRIEGETTVKMSDVQVRLQGPGRSYGMESGTLKEDGTLFFRSVEPNVYRFFAQRLSGLYLKSVRWGTADVTDGEIDLSNGAPPRTELSVTLGADAAELSATVKNSNSEPVDSAVVTLVPVGPRRSPSFHKSATTDANGHFILRGIAPGSYKIFAWDKVDTNEVIYNPDFLQPYDTAGQTIELAPNGKHAVELTVIHNPQAQ